MQKTQKCFPAIISWLLVAAILSATLLVFQNVSATPDAPAEVLLHDGVTAKDGVVVVPGGGSNAQRTFDFDGAATNNHLTFRFNTAADLTGCNVIQFDLNLSTSPETWAMWKDCLKFVITVGGSSAAAPPFNDGINYTWPVPAALAEGSNQVTLELGHIQALGVDLSNVTRFGIGSYPYNSNNWRMDGVTLKGNTTNSPANKSAWFNMNSGANNTNTPPLAADMTIALRNVYGRYAAPEYNEADLLSHGGYGWISQGATRLSAAGSGSDAVAYDIFDEAVDVTNKKYLEFDFFISDLAAFRAETRSGGTATITPGTTYNYLFFRFNTQGRRAATGGSPAVNTTGFDIALDGYTRTDGLFLDDQTKAGNEYLSDSGWTHIRIPMSSFTTTQKLALANLKSFAIGFSPDGVTTNPLTKNYAFGFKNLRATDGVAEITQYSVDAEGSAIDGAAPVVTPVNVGGSFTKEIPEIEGYLIKGYKIGEGGTLQSGTTVTINPVSEAAAVYFVYEAILPEPSDEVLLHDGVTAKAGVVVVPGGGSNAQRTFDFDGAFTNNHLTFRFNTAADLRACNVIQFDLNLSTSPETWAMWKDHLKFVVTVGGSSSAAPPFNDGINYTWPVPTTLVEGTNQVTLELDYIRDLGADLSKVTRFGIGSYPGNTADWRMDGVTLKENTATSPVGKSARFNMNSGANNTNTPGLTADMTVALRNVYARYAAPGYDEENLLSHGGYGWIAKGGLRLGAPGSGSDAVAYDVFDQAVDITNKKYLEFDFFISDLAAFRAETKTGGTGPAYNYINIKFNAQGRRSNVGGNPAVNPTGHTIALDGYVMADGPNLDDQTKAGNEYLSNSGWTHISVPIASFNASQQTALANLKSFSIGFLPEGQATDAITKPYAFGFKNLRVSGGMFPITQSSIDTSGNAIEGVSSVITVMELGEDFTEEIPEIEGYIVKGWKIGESGELQSGKTATIPSVSQAVTVYFVYEIDPAVSGKKVKFHDGTKAGTPSAVTANSIGPGAGMETADRVFRADYPSAQAWNNNIYMRLYEGADLSGCNKIEFEFFLYSSLETYDDWKPYLKFVLSTGGTSGQALKDAKHFSFPVPPDVRVGRNLVTLDLSRAIAAGADLSNVTRFALVSYNGTAANWESDTVNLDAGACGANAPIETNLDFGLRNVYGRFIAPSYAKDAKTISAGAISYAGTKAEGFLWLRPAASFSPIAVGGTLEFDYFISDLDRVKRQKAEGTGETVFTGIFAQVNMEGGETYEIPLHVPGASDNKVIKSGWTHVAIPIDGNTAWSNMSSFGIYIGDLSKVTAFGDNYVQGFQNLVVTNLEKLQVEQDGVLLSEGSYAYLNKGAIGDSANKKYTVNEAPLDGSKFHTIEFEMFVSDVGALKNDPNFNQFRIRIDTQLFVNIPVNESWLYYYNYSSQVVKNGWNHIVIPFENTGGIRRDFLIYLQLQVVGNADFRAPKSFILAYKNIVGKEKPQYDGPSVPDQAVKPDKNALYITNCESLAGDGEWIPAEGTLNTFNKSEGKASIQNIFYNQAIRGNSFRFIRNNPFSVTDQSELMLDLYISDIDLLKARTQISVRIYSDTRGTSAYTEWPLDLSKLKNGWNALSFDMKGNVTVTPFDVMSRDTGLKTETYKPAGFAETRSFDRSAVKGIYLLTTQASFGEDEQVIVQIDNIRAGGVAEGTGGDFTGGTGSDADGGQVDTGAGALPEKGMTVLFAVSAAALAGIGFGRRRKRGQQKRGGAV